MFDNSQKLEVLEPVSSENEMLAFTQRTRKLIVDNLTNNGKSIPADKGDKIVILAALDGMDKQTLGRMRIKTDDKAADSNAIAASAITKLLTSMNPRALENNQGQREVPVLDSNIPNLTDVEDETVLGTQSGTFESFSIQYPDSDIILKTGSKEEFDSVD